MEFRARVRFLANVCHVCKTKNTPFVCEVCRMIFYCSPGHRREDWPRHSPLCWALSKIAREGKHPLEASCGEDLIRFKHDVARRCRALLGRDLHPWEFEIIYHPRMCNVCREFNWKKLRLCKDCEFIFTCEKGHFRTDHGKWCRTFKLYSDMSTEPRAQGASLLDVRLDADHLFRPSMTAVLSAFQDESEKASVSELLTYPLTVLNSLTAIGAVGKRELTVVFVGAEAQAEVEPLDKWENHFLHRLDGIRSLNLIFLGPELRSPQPWGGSCEGCRQLDKTLNFKFIPGKLYHECSSESEAKPNLICAFNSGMYRDFGYGHKNTWNETMAKLFARGAPPVLITEYTRHELKLDLEKIRSFRGDVSFVLPLEMNPFASLKPGLNIISEDETPVIFQNYFSAIVRGAQGARPSKRGQGEEEEEEERGKVKTWSVRRCFPIPPFLLASAITGFLLARFHFLSLVPLLFIVFGFFFTGPRSQS